MAGARLCSHALCAGPGSRTPPGSRSSSWPPTIAWTKLIAFADNPALARCEIAAFRYRVLHVAARITRAARRVHLRIDKTWRWAAEIATGWGRIRTAFG